MLLVVRGGVPPLTGNHRNAPASRQASAFPAAPASQAAASGRDIRPPAARVVVDSADERFDRVRCVPFGVEIGADRLRPNSEVRGMAKQEHLAILKKGVGTWNRWREENPEVLPDLGNAEDLQGGRS